MDSSSDVRALLQHVAAGVRERVASTPTAREASVWSPGGDPQFDIDVAAERAVWDALHGCDRGLALYTEGTGLRTIGPGEPDLLLVVDPIDGTRSAAAGLEMAMVSVAAAPADAHACLGDVEAALLVELKSGAALYVEGGVLEGTGYGRPIPSLSPASDTATMFWALEFNGHPARLMTRAYGHLIDASANRGGVFVFSSATFAITRIVTGQLDAYVDVGNRLLREHPELKGDFERVGGGHVLHLFPYDLAAAVPIARAAGVTISDGFGRPLDSVRLLDASPANQRSCIAACTAELHTKLLGSIDWEVSR